MPIDVNEAVLKIKRVGATKVRVVPMNGQSATGLHQVEIDEDGAWTPVVTGVLRVMADGIVSQATNRVICG